MLPQYNNKHNKTLLCLTDTSLYIYTIALYRDNLRLKNRVRAFVITGEIMVLFWDDEVSEKLVASILRVKTTRL